MRTQRFHLIPIALMVLLTAAALPFAAAAAPRGAEPLAFGSCRPSILDLFNMRVFGLTADQRLVCFREKSPAFTVQIGYIYGLTGDDTSLIGIDYRVQDGKLYGVGDAGGVYTIDTGNAYATFVNQLTEPLEGSKFGVDFNPAADRLRIISDTGQNLRHDVNPGGVTLRDGVLAYTVGVTALGVTGAAYTNNDLDPSTATTLYDIDSTLNQVAIQSPANAGSLAPTGLLGVDAAADLGFDIYSTVRNGVTVDVQGFAALTSVADGVTRFYVVNLPTGKATLRGTVRSDRAPIDIALPLNQR